MEVEIAIPICWYLFINMRFSITLIPRHVNENIVGIFCFPLAKNVGSNILCIINEGKERENANNVGTVCCTA